MKPSSRFSALRTALAMLLSLALATGPVFAQEEEEGNSGSSNGPSNSLDSGGSLGSEDEEENDSDWFNSDDDSNLGPVLLVAAVVTAVVVSAADANRKKRNRRAAEAMKKLRKVETVLEESATNQSPLAVIDRRPADSREDLLTADQRKRAMVITAAATSGEQLAFTVDRDAAQGFTAKTLHVQSQEAGWQVTGDGRMLSFVPNLDLVKLMGHRARRQVPATPDDVAIQ